MKKKYLTFFTVIVLFISNNTNAQNIWAPLGATWHYEISTLELLSYERIESIRDTVIDGHICSILESNKHLFSDPPTYIYTYEENSKVWVYLEGSFRLLYDFNLTTGDTTTTINYYSPFEPDPQIIIQDSGLEFINDIQLRYIIVKFLDQGSNWGFNMLDDEFKIYEKIGSLGYMFAQEFVMMDYPYTGFLRCYSDSEFGNFDTGISDSCTQVIVANSDIEVPSSIRITSDHINQFISIYINSSPVQGQYEIFNISGQLIKKENLYNNTSIVKTSIISKGIYILKVVNGKEIMTKKVIIN